MAGLIDASKVRGLLRAALSASPFGRVLRAVDEQRREAARRRVARDPWVRLPGTGVMASVNPADERGIVLAANGGCTDLGLARLWDVLARTLAPQVVLDVGANYGEVSLGQAYRPTAEVHLFEPNPTVAAHLEKTVEGLRGPNPVQLHRVALSDRAATLSLHVDPAYSGTASLRPQGEGRDLVEVTARPLDEQGLDLAGRRVLMKIDVEGAEASVFAGATRSIREAALFVAVVEFCHLPVEDLRAMERDFELFIVHPDRLRLEPTDAARLYARRNERRILKDAVLVRRDPAP